MSPEGGATVQVSRQQVTAAAASIVCLWMVGWALIEPRFGSGIPVEWVCAWLGRGGGHTLDRRGATRMFDTTELEPRRRIVGVRQQREKP